MPASCATPSSSLGRGAYHHGQKGTECEQQGFCPLDEAHLYRRWPPCSMASSGSGTTSVVPWGAVTAKTVSSPMERSLIMSSFVTYIRALLAGCSVISVTLSCSSLMCFSSSAESSFARHEKRLRVVAIRRLVWTGSSKQAVQGACEGQQLAQSTHVKGGHFVLQRLVFYMQLIAASGRIALPLDVVLGLLFYQAYALQYIGDVIDPSLLHLRGSLGIGEMSHCFVFV